MSRILYKAIKSLWILHRLYGADKYLYKEVLWWKRCHEGLEEGINEGRKTHSQRDLLQKKAASGSLAPTAAIYIFSFQHLDVATWINNILFLSCFVVCKIEEHLLLQLNVLFVLADCYSWLISMSVLHFIQNVISYLKTSNQKIRLFSFFQSLRLSFPSYSPSSATLKCPDGH